MNARPTIDKLTAYSKATIITRISLLIFILVIAFGFMRNYLIDRFMPQSRIDFTVYSPNAEQHGRQLIIDNYMQPFDWNLSRAAKVVTEDIPRSSFIYQQKSQNFTPRCKGEFPGKCSVLETKKGQKYTYTTDRDKSRNDPNFIDEWVHLEKGGTDVIVHRNEHENHPMNTASWNSYIDILQPIPVSQLDSFYYMGGEEIPFSG